MRRTSIKTVFLEMVTSQMCLSTEGGFAVSNFYYTVLYENRIGPRPVFHFTGALWLNGKRAGARFDFQNPHHHSVVYKSVHWTDRVEQVISKISWLHILPSEAPK